MARAGDAPSDGELLAPLLSALAESLDVREIFARISTEARRIVAHEFLMLGLVNEDSQRIRVLALSEDSPGATGDVEISDPLRLALAEDSFLLEDVAASAAGDGFTATLRGASRPVRTPIQLPAQPLFRHLYEARGLRSFLRVPVRLRGGVLGGLVFGSSSSRGFSAADFPRASPIAACVALALAHQRLAEEEQRSAEARDRAARLELRVKCLRDELEAHGRHRAIGTSPTWNAVLDQVRKVAPTEATVLLVGESGTGKEVLARLIHRASPRGDGPFVALNCAALPEQLLESELFGHDRGAFTGAISAREGKIEQASAGVVFLDEVGEMSPGVQAKLLRVLQEREYQRVGGVRTLRADIRVLAATNRDLKAAISRGTFREDLYYRLAVFDIVLPPLRERAEDIGVLVDAFLEDIGRSVGRPAAGMSQDARDRLVAYSWPGNVRELRNAIERAVILCEGGMITREHLPLGIAAPSRPAPAATSPPASPPAAARTIGAAERELILQALAQTGNNKSKAARLLGLTRAQLRSRIEKHGLSSQE